MMERRGENIISVESLAIGYISGKRKMSLLPPVTASAGRGEMVAVIGRNGIGKSTLLRTIMRLQQGLGGRVLFNGREISQLSRRGIAREAAYISTEIVNASNMRVYDLAALGRYPYTNWMGTVNDADRKAIAHALERTGMTGFSARYISELSDGERQRAMIARALAQETEILVMDEPTAFLDIAGRYEMIYLLSRLARDGRTIVFSTHDFNIALDRADKIWLMLDDKLVQGAPEDLMLSGSFNHLFNSDILGFNAADGNFTMKPVCRGEISVKGKGIIKEWTLRAAKRTGYLVRETEEKPLITAPSVLPGRWTIEGNDYKLEFESIYKLAGWLSGKSV
ncbi:MAG: ABC transporter ATP-binding protein [Bacteroidales bacterium]|jgi:iron complex transport system ATP-binding protein